MTNVNQKPSPFDFDDYRSFLEGQFLFQKSQKPSYSLAVFARQLGMSKMGAKYLLDRKRHLDESRLATVEKAFGLTKPEVEYFELLLKLAKTRSLKERATLFSNAVVVRKGSIGEHFLKTEEFDFLTNWLHPVIAEMSYLDGFICDAAWIRPRIKIRTSPKAVEKALSLLTKRGFLKGGAMANTRLKVPSGVRSLLYKEFLTQQLDVAKESIVSMPSEEREVFNLVMSVDDELYGLAKAMIDEFRHKLHQVLASERPCNRVVQITGQMVTVATTNAEEEVRS